MWANLRQLIIARMAASYKPYAQTSTVVRTSHSPIANGKPTLTKSPNL